ncbi:hypothetical protein [Methylobacterium nodulans]|uniref:Uncharacterized protein n=1 Tax=Methylobacterium nodulans (strain LMG 21967 / CNCM I-2342 / ORS 2060) TaxID=460265 RepID=B8IPN0_METNO|nr:hypothetical protein [Methylobacterium nodulans]ACL62322.1 hypothetical protein Mnod_7586 [Methylobacterium nodulans ORS 2060]
MSEDALEPRSLASYPYVVVRVACTLCPHRQGTYRLARLAAKFGPEMGLDEVLDRIAFDCPWRPSRRLRPGNQYVPKCKASFVDLEQPRRPPDLPPGLMGLRVVKGGCE